MTVQMFNCIKPMIFKLLFMKNTFNLGIKRPLASNTKLLSIIVHSGKALKHKHGLYFISTFPNEHFWKY